MLRGAVSGGEAAPSGGNALTGRGHRYEGDTGVWLADVDYILEGTVTRPNLGEAIRSWWRRLLPWTRPSAAPDSHTTAIPQTRVPVVDGGLLRYPRDEAIAQGLLTEVEAQAIFEPPADVPETLPGPRVPPPYLFHGQAAGVSFAEHIKVVDKTGHVLTDRVKELIRQQTEGFLPPHPTRPGRGGRCPKTGVQGHGGQPHLDRVGFHRGQAEVPLREPVRYRRVGGAQPSRRKAAPGCGGQGGAGPQPEVCGHVNHPAHPRGVADSAQGGSREMVHQTRRNRRGGWPRGYR